MKRKSEIIGYSPVRLAPRIKLTTILYVLHRAKKNVGGDANTGLLVDGKPASIDEAISAVRKLIRGGEHWLYTERPRREDTPLSGKSN